MIQRYESTDSCLDNDGSYVLHTDHLDALSALEEECKRMREELALFKSDMPPAKDIADLMAYYDSCESMYLNHGFRLEEGDFERFRRANIWIRSIAGKGEGT